MKITDPGRDVRWNNVGAVPVIQKTPHVTPVGTPTAAAAARQAALGMPLLAGLSYCSASAGMVLLNKLVLSNFDFHSYTILLIAQCIFCLVAVRIASAIRLVQLEPWNWTIASTWFPSNVVFVAMLWTSLPALQLLGVGMVTILKSLTNLLTIFGDILFFGKSYGAGVWATLGLMALSAACGAITDINFNAAGYAWQLLNCFCTAGYSLTLRGAMDKVVPFTRHQARMNGLSMVMYNNLLSLPLLVLVAVLNGEIFTVFKEQSLRDPRFQAAVCMSVTCGFLISFCSLWFLSSTTATTYSLVGSLNKLPLAIVGLIFFDHVWNTENIVSILVGLIAGIVFARAKQAQPSRSTTYFSRH